jgi:hypothetical protein
MKMKKAKSTQCVLLKGFDESHQKDVGVKRRQSLLKGFDESPQKEVGVKRRQSLFHSPLNIKFSYIKDKLKA